MNSKAIDIEAIEEIERREEICSRSSVISSPGPVIDLDKEEREAKVDHLQVVAHGRRTIIRKDILWRMSLSYRRACRAAYEASVAAKMADEIEQD